MDKAVVLFVSVILPLVVGSGSFQNEKFVHTSRVVDFHDRKTVQTENNIALIDSLRDFWSIFWTSPYLDENSLCKTHADIVLREANQLNFWALQILDSSAKLPSGILSGNLNQYGDFDECLISQGFDKNHKVKGKYCLANIAISFGQNEKNETIRIIDNAIHSQRMITNKLLDHSHRIAKWETFNWGVCVPASCTSKEIETVLEGDLKEKFNKNAISFEVSVSDDVCYVAKENKFSLVKSAVIFFFLTILVLIILGTFIDTNRFALLNVQMAKVLKCFSLKNNLSLLLKTSSSEDDIACLHGARFLNAVALLLSHKQYAMLFSPMSNRTAMSEILSQPWTMLGRSAILYTDSFILISGLLVSYLFIKDLDTKGHINFKDKLISRLVRFTPNLCGIILFSTYVMENMSSGPQWGLVVSKYSNLCKKYMWRNFLYIHNLFGFENMCLTHTHQLGIDMQLFLISPVFIYLLWKSPKIGLLLIISASTVSTWLRYSVTHQDELSTLLFYGISVGRLWKTANKSYILPTHRLTVYLMGVLLGYFLKRGGKNLKLNGPQVVIGWFLAITAGLFAVFEPYKASLKGFVYDVNIAANFNAFSPILWAIFMSWAVIACVNGHGGLFNDFLSWKYFRVFTKISYAVYLTQFPVFFYNVGTERTVQYFKGLLSLFDIPELCVILIASVILTLTFDIPFQELKKAFMTDGAKKKENKEEKLNNVDLSQDNVTSNERKRLNTSGTK